MSFPMCTYVCGTLVTMYEDGMYDFDGVEETIPEIGGQRAHRCMVSIAVMFLAFFICS